jgi:hypothetical protein
MARLPKIGCIVATAAAVAFFGVIYFEFLSHHNVSTKLCYWKGGKLANGM